jgi:tetratricopeptide (TPR) repeat protein
LGQTKVTMITLAELTAADSLAMVREALRVTELPAEVGDAIHGKTKGNPLFLEEVIHSLQAPGVLDRILSASSVTLAAQLAALGIPDRVQGLLMSRIDGLPPGTREVLKVGSAVGRSFNRATLVAIDEELIRPVPLDQALEELVATTLVVHGEETAAPSFTFRHALVQDVAYESLPFARRRDLHGRIAQYLESTQTPPDHGLLVHHYQRSGNADETRVHATRAAASSVAVYAYREGIDYLAIALDTTQERTSQGACLRSRLEEMAGDYLEAVARHDEAIERYRNARHRWSSPAVRRVAAAALQQVAPLDDVEARDSHLCWKIAVSEERGRSAYRHALQWLDRATASLPPGREALAARILITKSLVLSRLGRLADALPAGQEGLALALRGGDAGLQAYAQAMLANTLFGLGLFDRAIDANKEAIELYREVGDLGGQGSSQGNLAACYQLVGDIRSALRHNELALALHSRLSYTTGIAITQNNLGELRMLMGDTEGAIVHLKEAVGRRDEQGVSPASVGWAFINLSKAYSRLGRLLEAEEAAAEGRGLLQRTGARALLLDVAIQEISLLLARGRLHAAERSCRAMIGDARALGAPVSEAQGLCMLARIKLARQDAAGALENAQASAALAEKSGVDYERGQALLCLAEARGLRAFQAQGGAGQAEGHESWRDALDQAIHLFRKMGAQYDLDKALEVCDRLESSVCDKEG